MRLIIDEALAWHTATISSIIILRILCHALQWRSHCLLSYLVKWIKKRQHNMHTSMSLAALRRRQCMKPFGTIYVLSYVSVSYEERCTKDKQEPILIFSNVKMGWLPHSFMLFDIPLARRFSVFRPDAGRVFGMAIRPIYPFYPKGLSWRTCKNDVLERSMVSSIVGMILGW